MNSEWDNGGPEGAYYAVRAAGQEGWRLEDSRLSRAVLRDELRARGEVVEDVVVIAPVLRRAQGMTESIAGMVATEHGWAFDPAADCWRAPDEPMLPLPGIAEPVGSIEVVYGFPKTFMMDITLAAGTQRTGFFITNTFDPIPQITPWLERVLDGGFPRLLMDREGRYTELHVFPAEHGVRLVCMLFEDVWSKVIDISLDRLALVAGFYRPLVALWESAELAARWRNWDFDLAVSSRPPPESLRPYSVQSVRIDAALTAREAGGAR